MSQDSLPISIVVKFKESVDLPYDEDGVEIFFEERDIAQFDIEKFRNVTFQRVFTALKPEQIELLVTRAMQLDPAYKPPKFRAYFRVVSKNPQRNPLTRDKAESLAENLRSWETVEAAYISPVSSDPTVNVPPNPLSPKQGHLKPAPDGIDAEYAWTVPGGDGSVPVGAGPGLRMIDLEQGWKLDHEDLPTKDFPATTGLCNPPASVPCPLLKNSEITHGTSVLGIICALDTVDKIGNKFGCIGIVPNLVELGKPNSGSVKVISHWSGSALVAENLPDNILTAIGNLSFGDVLVLEVQGTDGTAGSPLLPRELQDDATFQAIRLATALGFTVIEAAGNGPDADLDKYPQLDRQSANAGTNLDYRDSGAIVVAAAQSGVVVVAAGGSKGHQKLNTSNFGSRIDCYAWGDGVVTTAADIANLAANLYTGDLNSTKVPIPHFGATSAATAIVAGAALSVQGMAQAKGFRLSPKQLRAILSDRTSPPPGGPLTNTPSDDPKIGVMPNLAWIYQNALAMAPDLYIRDFVGDIGDPHTGAISTSPDIIVRNATVSDPALAFGAGSGTENNSTLSSEVKAGQDNYIYVRVLNRGPAAAVNVTATVYWSPVATLVTPNLWTLVGSITIPIVPSNLLTVSAEIKWLAANIPAPGHYCFVGLIGNAADPAPNTAAFQNWANYQSFIRNNNNVTWRNFNVMNTPTRRIDDQNYAVLDFIAPGTPEKNRQMQLDVVAHLPEGARILLEGPAEFLDLFDSSLATVHEDEHGNRMVRVIPQGRSVVGRALFLAHSRTALRLLAHIPEEFGENRYDVFVSQIFEGLEVGRVTWRLKPVPNEIIS